jgi:hypothetical protein
MLNPVPLTLLAEIETAAVPVLDSVTVADVLLFTATFPKATLDGLALSVPCIPVPLRGMDNVPFVAVDVIVMPPEAAPAPVGVNETEKLAALPATIVCPAETPLVPNPEPDAVN